MHLFGMLHTRASAVYTYTALRTFFQHTPLFPDDRVVLIDNDGSFDSERAGAEFGEPALRRLTIMTNGTERGFAENANQLVRQALMGGAHLVLLNNDVVFSPHWLGLLAANDQAITSPLSNREVHYGLSTVVTTSARVAKVLLCGMPMDIEQYRGNEYGFLAVVETHQQEADGYWEVFVAPFFAVRIPHPVLTALGYFDESFGRAGGEDYDYCFRAHLGGFSVQYALKSYMLHFGGKSSWSGVESPEERRLREENFCAVFRRKWGERLFSLVLEENADVLQALEGTPAAQASDVRSKVQQLLEGEAPALYLECPEWLQTQGTPAV